MNRRVHVSVSSELCFVRVGTVSRQRHTRTNGTINFQIWQFLQNPYVRNDRAECVESSMEVYETCLDVKLCSAWR